VGVLHPLTEPSHILLIVTLSLLLGSCVTQRRFTSLASLFGATAAGMILAFVLAPFLPTQSLILLVCTGLGLILVLSRALPDWFYPLTSGVSGFLLALESIPEPGPFLDVFITAFGSLVGIHYLVMYGARLVTVGLQRWQTPITGIVLRVAGSWITAIGCLTLAFVLTGML